MSERERVGWRAEAARDVGETQVSKSRAGAPGKLADYAKMGIPQIWVIDPEDGACLRYLNGELLRSEVFEEASRGISFRIEEIGKLVRR